MAGTAKKSMKAGRAPVPLELEEMPFWEGQSYGVIPPGTKINSKGKEVPHGVRLYS